jgi:hypothetical protein
MRILKVVSSLTPKGQTHGRGSRFFARAVRVVAGVALTLLGQTAAYVAPAQAQVPKSNSSQKLSMSPTDWVCPRKKSIPANQFSTEGIQQGVKEALRILENCPTCRQFFGDFDAAPSLRRLMSMGAILISDVVPKGIPAKGRDVEFVPIPEVGAAFIEDYSFRQDGVFYKPCIYVNPKRFLVVEETSLQGYGLEGLPLAQARGVAILHEMAHVADVIPSDGSKGMYAEQSKKNTICVRQKCLMCDGSRGQCPTIASYRIIEQRFDSLRLDQRLEDHKLDFINVVIRECNSELRHGP